MLRYSIAYLIEGSKQPVDTTPAISVCHHVHICRARDFKLANVALTIHHGPVSISVRELSFKLTVFILVLLFKFECRTLSHKGNEESQRDVDMIWNGREFVNSPSMQHS